jgi:hypothetical protein
MGDRLTHGCDGVDTGQDMLGGGEGGGQRRAASCVARSRRQVIHPVQFDRLRPYVEY